MASLRHSQLLLPLGVDLIFLLLLLLPCLVASSALSILLKGLEWQAWPATFLVAGLPLLYVFWLFLLCLVLVGFNSLLGIIHQKPKRANWRAGTLPPLSILICIYHYWLGGILYALPGGRLLLTFSVLKWLVLRSCATRSLVSLDGTSIFGILQDPDLIMVEPNVVIGDRASVVAHAFSTDPSGKSTYQTAAIRIHSGATIGGDVLIELGVVIGSGAIVEPYSRVQPFTTIGENEVWGGVPAVRLRHRFASASPPANLAVDESHHKVENLIAVALGLPLDSLTPQSSSSTVEGWDSLGKMAIAAALETHYGVKVAADQIFALDTVAAIQRQLQAARPTIAASGHQPSGPNPHPRDPELLPLLDVSQATAQLFASPPPRPDGAPIKVVVASTFVAEPLEASLRLWCHAFGLPLELHFAGFNQIAASLLDPRGPFNSVTNALGFILCRPEDLCSKLHPDGREPASSILAAIETYTASGQPLFVADLPPVISQRFAGDRQAVAELQLLWRDRLAAMPGVTLLPFADVIVQVGVEQASDEAMEERASTPYRTRVYHHLAAQLARAIRRLHLPAKKVIALDADNTLWAGVLGEDGADGVRIESGYSQFQRQLRRLREQGVLLVLVSKNQESDVLSLMQTHGDMILRPEDFVSHRIGWREKSESLTELATELNLSLQAFVFMDDNPVECAAVAARCPQVTVVSVPEDCSQIPRILDRLWCFDGIGTSAEDRQRTAMLVSEKQRKIVQQQSNSLADYLDSLFLSVSLRLALPEDIARLAQLSQRTNQFNLSCRRRNEHEIAQLLAGDAVLWLASASDRFGDYGSVGAVIITPANQAGTSIMDTFLLSCRALGRGVEEAILHGICQHLREQGQTQIMAPYVVTARNTPVLEFFRRQQWLEAKECFSTTLDSLPILPKHVKLTVLEA